MVQASIALRVPASPRLPSPACRLLRLNPNRTCGERPVCLVAELQADGSLLRPSFLLLPLGLVRVGASWWRHGW